jgi:hypothetical protein
MSVASISAGLRPANQISSCAFWASCASRFGSNPTLFPQHIWPRATVPPPPPICPPVTMSATGPLRFEQVKPTAVSDRVCKAFTVCSSGFMEDQAPTPTKDRTCKLEVLTFGGKFPLLFGSICC